MEFDPQANGGYGNSFGPAYITGERIGHIIDEHLIGSGNPDASLFPSGFTEADIIPGALEIANNPDLYPGGRLPTTPGASYEVSGLIDSIPTNVVVAVDSNGSPFIVTAYPTRNYGG